MRNLTRNLSPLSRSPPPCPVSSPPLPAVRGASQPSASSSISSQGLTASGPSSLFLCARRLAAGLARCRRLADLILGGQAPPSLFLPSPARPTVALRTHPQRQIEDLKVLAAADGATTASGRPAGAVGGAAPADPTAIAIGFFPRSSSRRSSRRGCSSSSSGQRHRHGLNLVPRKEEMVIPPPVRPAKISQYLKPYVLRMHFTNKYVSAQVVHTPTATVASSASSQEKQLRTAMENTRDVAAAAKIGKLLGERLLLKGIPAVSVLLKREQKYHGKVKAVIDSVRDAGVKLL